MTETNLFMFTNGKKNKRECYFKCNNCVTCKLLQPTKTKKTHDTFIPFNVNSNGNERSYKVNIKLYLNHI